MPAEAITLRNAFNGETFVFPADPGTAEVTRFDVRLEPGGSGGGNALRHVHPLAEERLTVRAGCLVVTIAGEEHRVVAGQSVVVPRGAAHFFRNGGSEAAEITIAFSPPQRHRGFFMAFAALAERRPQWFSAKGDPHLLLIALHLHRFAGHLYLAGPPVWLQRLVFAVLAPVARLCGYRGINP